MAQTRKKSTSSRSKPAQSKSASSGGRASSQSSSGRSRSAGGINAAQGKPRRREIAACICLLLGVFSFIGYFDAEPVFIGFFTGFIKRLIGYGFYAAPPALIMCSVILGFHKGYPVLLRTISAISIAGVVGALAHIFIAPIDEYGLSFSMLGRLWTDGALLRSGGIISGGITQLFYVLFGAAGTIITLIIIAAILVLIAFNATVSGILGAFSGRKMRRYEIEQFDEAAGSRAALENDMPNPAQEELHHENARRHRYPLLPPWGRKKIDIPLDDKKTRKTNYFSDAPLNDLYNKTPNAMPPDKLLGTDVPVDTAGQGEMFGVTNGSETGNGTSDNDLTKRQIEDLTLDIPFINDKWEPTKRVVPPIESVSISGEPVFGQGHFKAAGSTPAASLKSDSDAASPAAVPKKRMPLVPEPEGADDAAVVDSVKKTVSEIMGDDDITEPQYTFPPPDLLSGSNGKIQSRAGENEVSLNIERLEAAFQSFGITVNITNATRGPSVTRYEAELEAGIKLSRLTNLADDIALALGTIGVRIAAMPNKRSTVGIEVPNKSISTVFLRDIIESDEFKGSKSKLTFAIGMDISGDKIVGDISKLPHLLIAGTTGSGKSVCLNSIILSLLYKATPEELRLIMIDPKMVEFKVYQDIPHLLVPLVTEAKKAAGALQWATFEMMKRYNLFSEANARDIAGYNLSIKKDDERKPMPGVVIIIDELADLMLTAAKEVEESVCRIAQMGRAAGIHLVIATQSPRANVITGLMKANIPSRIAFKVASALESQIILDPGQNADKLVGNGDMLYSPTGIIKPMRVQGTWVSDREREKVVDFIKKTGSADFDDEVVHEIDKLTSDKADSDAASGGDGQSGDYDELLPQAVDVFLESGQASVSLLQRRLRLGYARAARIVDQMEEMGIIGSYEGSKSREMLVTRDQWRQMQHGTGVAPTETVSE